MRNSFGGLAAMLASEFGKYMRENTGTVKAPPPNAMVIFKLDGENAFNEWHRAVSLRNREPRQPIYVVNVRRFRKRSAIGKASIRNAERLIAEAA